MAELGAIVEAFAEEIAPERQLVRAGELSPNDFGAVRDEAVAGAVQRAAEAGAEAWELYRSMLANRSLHWADRWLAASRLHDPAVVPQAASRDIATTIEEVLRDPATRYQLMLHTVMAVGILRGRDPAVPLYPVSRETIDEVVVPYVERGAPGDSSYEGQMRSLEHSLHLLATLVRLGQVHREDERSAYEQLLKTQLGRVIELYEANRDVMMDPDEPAAYFQPAHVMEHLAEAMEEAGRSRDPRAVHLFTERHVPRLFQDIDAECASRDRTPARVEEFRGQAAVFATAAAGS